MRFPRFRFYTSIRNNHSYNLPKEDRKSGFFCVDHFIHSLLVLIVIGLLALVTINLSPFNPIQRALADFELTDAYFYIAHSEGNHQLDSTIIIVDATALHKRDSIGYLLSEIAACSPSLIVIDLIFQDYDTAEGDSILMNSLHQLPNTIVSTKLTDYRREKGVFTNRINSFFAERLPIHQGYVNVPSNINGGCIRQYTCWQRCQGDTVFSLPYLAANLYQGVLPNAVTDNERLIIFSNNEFFVMVPDSIPLYPYLLRDKIVLVGTDKEEDMHMTPIGKLSGVKLNAYAIQTVLQHGQVGKTGCLTNILITFFLCYFAAWVGCRIKTRNDNNHFYLLRLFYFILIVVLITLGFFTLILFDYQINILLPLLGIALIEEIRIHYVWCISYIKRKVHLKYLNRWAKKSIYY